MSARYLSSFSLLPERAAIALYGAGETATDLARLLARERADCRLVCYLDSWKNGTKDNVPIVKFGTAGPAQYDEVIIASIFWPEIERALLNGEIVDYWIPTNAVIHKACPLASFGAFYPEDRRDDRRAPTFFDQCENAARLFTAERDKELYAVLVNLRRKERDPEAEFFRTFAFRGAQYLEHVSLAAGATVVDGGVFDGSDTLRFAEVAGPEGSVHGFEPNRQAYAQGGNSSVLAAKQGVRINFSALGEKEGWVRIAETPSSACAVESVESGEGEGAWGGTRVVRLDDYVETEGLKRVDLIKLDIEGGEIEALKGAQRTIRRFAPQIAVSIYHRPGDLHEIPLMLHGLLPSATFRLGHYSAAFVDTVLYVLPEPSARA